MIGYEGVILGSILSQVIIICIWKPILLFHDGLKSSVMIYFRRVVFRYIVIVIDVIAFDYLFAFFLPHRFSSYFVFGGYSLVVAIIVTVFVFGEFLCFSQGTRDFFVRIKGVIQHKYN